MQPTPPKQNKLLRGCLGIAILLVIIVVIAFIFGIKSEKEAAKPKKHTAVEALVASYSCVKEQLKSPSTAEFGTGTDGKVRQVNDTVFIINNYVDSQNGFGATVRTDYYCEVYYTSDGRAFCKNINLVPR